jgi:hypothetical protein
MSCQRRNTVNANRVDGLFISDSKIAVFLVLCLLVNSNKAHGFDRYQAQSGILERLLH